MPPPFTSGDVVCDCSACTCGAPKKFKMTISGVTGCGDCVPSCAEGALQVVDGKVRLRAVLTPG